jgi:rod shape determining protein RodA
MGIVMNIGLQSSAYNKELKKKNLYEKEEYL